MFGSFRRKPVIFMAMVASVTGVTIPNGAVAAQRPARGEAVAPAPTSYADVADFAVESETIIDAFIRVATPLEPARAINVPAGYTRYYIEADVQAVLYGRQAVGRSVAYLVDVAPGPDGRLPRLRRQRVLLFARALSATNQIQLVRTTAQLPWSAGHDATARMIAAELARGSIPPQITGISQAFTVAGTVAGESETQIFLSTASNDPVSLTILRRPGQAPAWAVAFGEIVDESATVPAPRTIGWYRLACGLPARVPAAALGSASADEARAIAADYALVLAGVGRCDRTPAVMTLATPARR